jgi:hypothetical protein
MAPSRPFEFTNPKMHAGWQGGRPVFVVFNLASAKILFEEFEQPCPIAICVDVPHAALAENFEQAVHFFSADHVASTLADAIFAV